MYSRTHSVNTYNITESKPSSNLMAASIINSTNFTLAYSLSQIIRSHLALSQLPIVTATEKHGSTAITHHNTFF